MKKILIAAAVSALSMIASIGHAQVQDSFNTSMFNTDTRQTPRGTAHGSGVAIDLNRNQRVAVEYNNGSNCFEFVNSAAGSQFLFPTNNVNAELEAFRRNSGSSVRNCQHQYGAWNVAQLTCPANIACNTTTTVERTRECVRSVGRFVDCSSCGGSCVESLSCEGDRCGGDGGDGGGDDCLPANAMISLPNGAMTAISTLKVGDTVASFDANGVLVDGVVSFVNLTPGQEIFAINNSLEVTANHPMPMADGSRKLVSELSLGDELIMADGSSVVIEELTFTGRTELGYNLIIDGGEGFIAEGVRVFEESDIAKLLASR